MKKFFKVLGYPVLLMMTINKEKKSENPPKKLTSFFLYEKKAWASLGVRI